jgi:hypothetical protein
VAPSFPSNLETRSILVLIRRPLVTESLCDSLREELYWIFIGGGCTCDESFAGFSQMRRTDRAIYIPRFLEYHPRVE